MKWSCPVCGGHPVVVEGRVVPHANPPDGAPGWVPCQGGLL